MKKLAPPLPIQERIAEISDGDLKVILRKAYATDILNLKELTVEQCRDYETALS